MRTSILLAILCLLTACDNGVQSSDYIGGFVSSTEDCPSRGDLGVDYKDNQISISFYCFLKECSTMKGTVTKEGFFHLKAADGHYVQGKIKPNEASGNWFLTLRGKNCYGEWAALKN